MEFTITDWDKKNLILNHSALAKRIKRSLYYDPVKNPDYDTLSFSATKLAVESFRNAAPSSMKKLGHRYAARVAREACISPCSLLLGFIYIERLKNRNPEYLKNISSSDLFLISMMVASKYLYDEGIDEEVFNDEWALSGGLNVSEVNTLEGEFLNAMDWRIYVHPKEFHLELEKVEACIAKLNSLNRGWMTYTDFISLIGSYDIFQQICLAVKSVYRFTGICLIAYSGVLLTASLSIVALTSFVKHSSTYLPAAATVHKICIHTIPSNQPKSIQINDVPHLSVSDKAETDSIVISNVIHHVRENIFMVSGTSETNSKKKNSYIFQNTEKADIEKILLKLAKNFLTFVKSNKLVGTTKVQGYSIRGEKESNKYCHNETIGLLNIEESLPVTKQSNSLNQCCNSKMLKFPFFMSNPILCNINNAISKKTTTFYT